MDKARRVILVVDDDPDILALLRLHLTKAGYEVLVADSAAAARGRLKERMPDLIVSDINMPGMTGDELVFALKVDPAYKRVQILFLTSLEANEALGTRTLGHAVLSKPVVEKDLLAAIAGLLGKPA